MRRCTRTIRFGFARRTAVSQTLKKVDDLVLRSNVGRAKKTHELSFEEAFAEMAKDQEALAEVRQMNGTFGDGLEQDQS